jgi:hypothetical protein
MAMREMSRGLRREVHGVMTGATDTHVHLRNRLMTAALVTLVVDALGSTLAWLAERHGQGTEIHGYGDAAFWVSTQLLTVSSQLKNPVTTPGRVLDVVLELYAITVVTAVAGAFASFFHRRSHEQAPLQ